MKINGIPPKTLYTQYVHSKNKPASAQRAGMGTDTVEFSGTAQSFAAVLKAARETMGRENRAGRVDEVKRQVENGTYRVAGSDVAERILGDMGN